MKLNVKLLFLVGGWVVGREKNEIDAILNSKLKLELVEVGVELGNIDFNEVGCMQIFSLDKLIKLLDFFII